MRGFSRFDDGFIEMVTALAEFAFCRSGQRAPPSAVKISSAMSHKVTCQILRNGPPVLVGLHVVGWKRSGLNFEREVELFLVVYRQRVATHLGAVFR